MIKTPGSHSGILSYVLAQQWLATLAVEAVAAELGVVRRYTVTDLEFVDILYVCRKYMFGTPLFGPW